MIRKASHIVISTVLLILTMGFTVSQHYCGERLVDVSILSADSGGCSADGSCSMEMSCCHNEQHVFQLDEDYTQPIVIDHVPFIQIDLFVFELPTDLRSMDESQTEVFSDDESPPPLDVSTYLSSIQVYRL